MCHTGTVEHTGLADDPLGRETGDLLHMVGHQIEWIGDHDDHSIGGVLFDACSHLGDDVGVLANEVLSRHAGLPWEA